RPSLPFNPKCLQELFSLSKSSKFQKKYICESIMLLFSVIDDYVKLSITNKNVDLGYCTIAIKFFWQIVKANKIVRDEFLSNNAHIEFIVKILFYITRAKTNNLFIKRGTRFGLSAT